MSIKKYLLGTLILAALHTAAIGQDVSAHKTVVFSADDSFKKEWGLVANQFGGFDDYTPAVRESSGIKEIVVEYLCGFTFKAPAGSIQDFTTTFRRE